MTEDARFEDGVDKPARLIAADADDLKVISALVQDAVASGSDMTWEPANRRFVLLLNRFRWEDRSATQRPERVRALLIINDVTGVKSQGVEKGDADTILSLLGLEWQPGKDADGAVELTFAGDGALSVQTECLNVVLQDVTRPYSAVSGKAPTHPE